MKFLRYIFIFAVFLPQLSLAAPITESKQKMREFMVSVTYGTLAGALLGAASLAFTESPGDHMNRIAKGASLGLYAGIALGIYVTKEPSVNEELLEELDQKLSEPQINGMFQLLPSINEKKLDGGVLQYTKFF